MLRSFASLNRFRFFNKGVLAPPKPAQTMEWSIGIYTGDSPVTLTAPIDIKNPVLSRRDVFDRHADFVADPFMLEAKGAWYMFFEVMNCESDNGEIALATSVDGVTWCYQQIVLTEPFHLSYPYVFQWMDDYYMVPESFQARSVRLYRATQFPNQWSFVGTLLDGMACVDSSILHYNDTWWLFTSLGTPPYRADTLRLFHAERLMGPWLEHRKSPIVPLDLRMARPAGRVLVVNGRPIRYAQDCYPTYGSGVRAFEIDELTVLSYHENEIGQRPVLSGSGTGWNQSGMHHIDAHPKFGGGWMACVDGWFYRSNEAGE